MVVIFVIVKREINMHIAPPVQTAIGNNFEEQRGTTGNNEEVSETSSGVERGELAPGENVQLQAVVFTCLQVAQAGSRHHRAVVRTVLQ